MYFYIYIKKMMYYNWNVILGDNERLDCGFMIIDHLV